MATVRPFRAVHPTPNAAPHVAAVPYDVVDVEEARALAAGNALSFLHVSRPEIDLPPGADPHADKVYDLAVKHYQLLKHEAPLVRDDDPSVYVYRLHVEGHTQTGIAACFGIDEYENDIIKKHERTRKDKEDDRTRHITVLRAQTGPVFLTYRPSEPVANVVRHATAGTPLFDFEAIDGVRHSIWMMDEADARQIVTAFSSVKSLYIADGHHRAASAVRARSAVESDEARFFLAVAFPSDEVRILAYNRIVKDLNGRTPSAFLGELARQGFDVKQGSPTPEEKGEVSMYVDGQWHRLDLESHGSLGDTAVASLDCTLLEEKILGPLLGIGDIRTDRRIDFVSGARGTKALEQLVDAGKAAIAFSMYPVSVEDLMAVSDAGSIMPPKSTWFEPKLRDGLLIHEI